MKTIKYLAICASAFTLAACNVDEPVASEAAQKDLVKVYFGAEVVEPSDTKASLTPGETKFEADWQEGDEIAIQYYNAEFNGVTTATWNGAAFETDLPEYTGEWIYMAVYPSLGKYDCSNVSQTGDRYNSLNDLMGVAYLAVKGGAGMDENGKPVVFPMVRETSILYFHLTSKHDENVISAKLSAKTGVLSAAKVTVAPHETAGVLDIDREDFKSEINLNIEGQTADDFTLWFNIEGVEPNDRTATVYSYTCEDLTLTVTTETKTLTLTRAGEFTYEAGKVYKTEMAIANTKWESE